MHRILITVNKLLSFYIDIALVDYIENIDFFVFDFSSKRQKILILNIDFDVDFRP